MRDVNLQTLKIIEKKLGKDILPAERALLAAWRESLAYLESLCVNPKVDGDLVLKLKFREVACHTDYLQQCARLEEDPDAAITAVHTLITSELQRVFMDDVMFGDDDIPASLLVTLERSYG